MGDLFPGRKRFTRKNEKGEIIGEWSSDKIDWRARVVCEPCNNTWMSHIENRAKPVLSRFILGEAQTICQPDADVIAPFAFKSAVIFDHIRFDHAKPFFSRSARHRFRTERAIPASVRMFLAGIFRAGRERFIRAITKVPSRQTNRSCCTFVPMRQVISFFRSLARSRQGSPRSACSRKHFKRLASSSGLG